MPPSLTICDHNMPRTRDSEKKFSLLWTFMLISKFYDIWPTLRHVKDMSTTFPTKVPGQTKNSMTTLFKDMWSFLKNFPTHFFRLLLDRTNEKRLHGIDVTSLGRTSIENLLMLSKCNNHIV